jgi:hypothetical protein
MGKYSTIVRRWSGYSVRSGSCTGHDTLEDGEHCDGVQGVAVP